MQFLVKQYETFFREQKAERLMGLKVHQDSVNQVIP